jgi:Fe-S cluster biogenesis protein NfuA
VVKYYKKIKENNIMKEKVQAIMDKIRPSLQSHGGDAELVDVVDGVVKVRLKGACSGCPMSQMTIKNGIEEIMKKAIPEIKSVESVE